MSERAIQSNGNAGGSDLNGRQIAESLESSHMSQRDLAMLTDISVSSICRYISGERSPRRGNAEKIRQVMAHAEAQESRSEAGDNTYWKMRIMLRKHADKMSQAQRDELMRILRGEAVD